VRPHNAWRRKDVAGHKDGRPGPTSTADRPWSRGAQHRGIRFFGGGEDGGADLFADAVAAVAQGPGEDCGRWANRGGGSDRTRATLSGVAGAAARTDRRGPPVYQRLR